MPRSGRLVDRIFSYRSLIYCIFVYNCGAFAGMPAPAAERLPERKSSPVRRKWLARRLELFVRNQLICSMFLTSPDDRTGVTPQILGIQLDGWKTVMLSFPMRFFLPTWIASVGESKFPARAFLMLEKDLVGLIKEVGVSALQRLQYLMPLGSDPYRMQLREVSKLWSARGAMGDDTAHFLMEEEGGARFVHHGSDTSITLDRQVWPGPKAG